MSVLTTAYGGGLPAMQTTDQVIDRYLDSLDVKPRSKETYRKGVLRFASWLDSHGVSRPDRIDVLAYKNDLLKEHTACTVSTYLTAVKSFYGYLESEKVAPNIAAGIKGAAHLTGFKKDALTADQARVILDAMPTLTLEDKRNFALVNLLIRTGIRTVEAERANVEDIRSEAGEALLYVQGKGRDDKDDFVLLTENALRPIKVYLGARGKARPDAPLFLSHSDRNYGDRLTTRSISRIAKDALRAAATMTAV